MRSGVTAVALAGLVVLSAAAGSAGAQAPGQTPPPGPTITGASLTNKEFAVGPKVTALAGAAKPAPKAPLGTTMRIKASAGGVLRVLVLQREFGREVGGSCVAQTPANKKNEKCERLKTRATLTRTVRKAGLKRIAFSGRLADGVLKPDAYQFSISLIDAAKVRSPEKLIRFRVVKP